MTLEFLQSNGVGGGEAHELAGVRLWDGNKPKIFRNISFEFGVSCMQA